MRTYWRAELVGSSHDPVWQDRSPVSSPRDANLIASLTTTGDHMPAIDLDIPARLVPSSTAGHSHLFIDKPISWRQYKRVLRAMERAGLIERGFYRMSVKRGATFLRTHPKGVRER